jgi:hypothetical protein
MELLPDYALHCMPRVGEWRKKEGEWRKEEGG